jgi:thiamine kinase-like enzyme
MSSIKRIIKKQIKKYLHKAGFYIRYYPTVNDFCNFLENKPISVKEYELRQVTTYISCAEDHQSYEKLLKHFVPNWHLDRKEAKFIGKGVTGDVSLKAHRKVRIKDKTYFEKVYFNSNRFLLDRQWFDDHIYELIKDKIKVPCIQKSYRGSLLTIVYFDYFNLIELEEDKEGHLIQITKDLYRISCRNEDELLKLPWPDSVKEIKHPRFRKRLHLLEREVQEHKALEESVAQSKRIITHADIHMDNAFKNRILIDWDFFGLYPIGYDPAFVYYRLLITKTIKNYNYISWLHDHYKDVILNEDWPYFERNFIYFLLIFCYKRPHLFEKGRGKELEQQLIEKLKEYD